MTKKLAPTSTVLDFNESKCGRCTALCCRYFGLEIDAPEDERDFDQLLWYLVHGGTEIYVDEGSWYLNILSPCRHLLPDNRCGIYETRPYICRDYDLDTCEFENDLGFEHYFRTYDELVAYMRAKGIGGSYLKPGESPPKKPRAAKKSKVKRKAARKTPRRKSSRRTFEV